jgi:cytoskeletal protein CcmA (bactofilin family)
MFNSKPDSNPEPLITPPPPAARQQKASAPRPTNPPFGPAASPQTGVSVIGTDLTILGDKITIISQNKLQVDGQVRGDVHGKEIVVSKGGSVTGKVWAEKIDIRGTVDGSIVAVAIALHDTAKVGGDIMHQKLEISEGAEFDGSVKLVKDTSQLMPILDAEVIARGLGNGVASPYGN